MNRRRVHLSAPLLAVEQDCLRLHWPHSHARAAVLHHAALPRLLAEQVGDVVVFEVPGGVDFGLMW